MDKLKAYFVRHGLTEMNKEGRFCGTTNALLAKEGWDELAKLKETYDYPSVERLYTSPAIRCIETASVLYPGMEPVTKEGLWEYNFGQKEKCRAMSLMDEPYYEQWLDLVPDFAFEEGESLLETSFRARTAMTAIIRECRKDGIHSIAIVAHGVVLGQLMRYCLDSEEAAMEFRLSTNGMGLEGTIDMDGWFEKQEICFDDFFPKGAPRLKMEDSPYFARK